ncbi:hypothetical protein BO78DRAFT_158922 [Aspergillus sclerotiicarbonarius CBS 121057]|uniref:Uncharacterized protein n=1 Tax=Aspergillus sclerotiicarbonarius (strain CBS 121057 / IBT 28362) TaxID=1448318 RepID=A0A319EA36_ASPSB|nr:hypothetical protein BO78DRAFT_158922 [Aspergillus sclerotiicarbonarius CBS 121057]
MGQLDRLLACWRAVHSRKVAFLPSSDRCFCRWLLFASSLCMGSSKTDCSRRRSEADESDIVASSFNTIKF